MRSANSKGNRPAKPGVDQLDLTSEEKKTKKSTVAAIKRRYGENRSQDNYVVAGVDGSSVRYDEDDVKKHVNPRAHGIPCCNSWIDYWLMMTGKRVKPKECSIFGCGEMDPDLNEPFGLHVWVKGQHRDKRCYIIPGCRYHNKKKWDYGGGDFMKTKRAAILVPAPLTDYIRSEL